MLPITPFTNPGIHQVERVVVQGMGSLTTSAGMTSLTMNRTYCTTVGGVQGCCKLGHVCNLVTNQCTVADQQRCPNENFCCRKHPLDSHLPFLFLTALRNERLNHKLRGTPVTAMRTTTQDAPPSLCPPQAASPSQLRPARSLSSPRNQPTSALLSRPCQPALPSRRRAN